MEKKNGNDKNNGFSTLQKILSLITAIVSLLAAVIGCFTISEINNIRNDHVIMAEDSVVYFTVQDFKTQSKTIAQELWEAQKSCLEEDYYNALNIYEKFQSESSIACLNIWYFYSHGFACDIQEKTTAYSEAFSESDVIIGDINGDGSIIPKDITHLHRYLAGGWNVVLG